MSDRLASKAGVQASEAALRDEIVGVRSVIAAETPHWISTPEGSSRCLSWLISLGDRSRGGSARGRVAALENALAVTQLPTSRPITARYSSKCARHFTKWMTRVTQ
jgi:hypothetical protein